MQTKNLCNILDFTKVNVYANFTRRFFKIMAFSDKILYNFSEFQPIFVIQTLKDKELYSLYCFLELQNLFYCICQSRDFYESLNNNNKKNMPKKKKQLEEIFQHTTLSYKINFQMVFEWNKSVEKWKSYKSRKYTYKSGKKTLPLRDWWSFVEMLFVGQCEVFVYLGFVEIISFLYFFPWPQSS